MLYLTYKLTGNRKTSIVCASIVALVIFGAYHFQPDTGSWMRIVSDILIRGLGSIFEFYAYLKTKNIWVSYFIHLFYDIIPCFIQLF